MDDVAIKADLISKISGDYKLNENRLESEAVGLQVCRRHRQFLRRGKTEKYMMLNRLGEVEYIDDRSLGEKKPYVSGLYPTKRKNTYEFSVNGTYFELILKNAEEAVIRGTGAILEFEGGAK